MDNKKIILKTLIIYFIVFLNCQSNNINTKTKSMYKTFAVVTTTGKYPNYDIYLPNGKPLTVFQSASLFIYCERGTKFYAEIDTNNLDDFIIYDTKPYFIKYDETQFVNDSTDYCIGKIYSKSNYFSFIKYSFIVNGKKYKEFQNMYYEASDFKNMKDGDTVLVEYLIKNPNFSRIIYSYWPKRPNLPIIKMDSIRNQKE